MTRNRFRLFSVLLPVAAVTLVATFLVGSPATATATDDGTVTAAQNGTSDDEPPEPGDDGPSEPQDGEPPEPEAGEPEEPQGQEGAQDAQGDPGTVSGPDSGSGLRAEQVTVSVFMGIVVLLGALLAFAYRRR